MFQISVSNLRRFVVFATCLLFSPPKGNKSVSFNMSFQQMPNDDNVYLHLTFSSCVKCDFCPSGVTVLLCYFAVSKVHKVRVDGRVKKTSNVDLGEHCLLLFCIQSLIRKSTYKLTVQAVYYDSYLWFL